MLPKNIKELLEKNQYRIVGKYLHSAVQICRYTKRSLREEDVCWKEKFYGIKSHRCCQMSPAVMWCHNQCIHCWRPIELNLGTKIGKIDEPKEIIEGIIEGRKKLLMGFKGKENINIKKFRESLNPTLFTLSLSGEATLYPKITELIKEIRKRKAISFLVTNGLEPEKIKELQEKNCLPTQLILSMNSPNKKLYDEWHKSLKKDAWKKFNQTLKLMEKLKCRTTIQLTLVKDINMKKKYIKQYAKLIKKAEPMFIHIKAYASLGYSQQRINYKLMPTHQEIVVFSKELLKYLSGYKFLDEKNESRVVLLGKSKKDMKIKRKEI